MKIRHIDDSTVSELLIDADSDQHQKGVSRSSSFTRLRGYGPDDPRSIPGRGNGWILLLAAASRPALGLTRPTIQR